MVTDYSGLGTAAAMIYLSHFDIILIIT